MTLHRSHENTDHDMTVGIPLPMYVVDGREEVERLRAENVQLRYAIKSALYQLTGNSGYHYAEDYDAAMANERSAVKALKQAIAEK